MAVGQQITAAMKGGWSARSKLPCECEPTGGRALPATRPACGGGGWNVTVLRSQQKPLSEPRMTDLAVVITMFTASPHAFAAAVVVASDVIVMGAAVVADPADARMQQRAGCKCHQ